MHKQSPPFDTKHVCRDLHNKSIHYNCDNVKSYTANQLGEAAHDAVVLEIETAPKPGLVDALSSGCHGDMDYATFLRSANALRTYWKLPAEIGLRNIAPKDAMPELRSIGKEMETAMFAATGGVNTHKGLIYHLSLLLYGAGYTLAQKKTFTAKEIMRCASLPVAGSVENELVSLREKQHSSLSNGEKLFLKYGVTGARGEAERSFPSAQCGLETLLASLSRGAALNDASLAALLSIMAVCEDSNVIHRAGYDFWKNEYCAMIKNARDEFDPIRPDFKILHNLEKQFLPFRISPGGAADLLCCSLFVNIVTNPTCQH